MTAARDWRGLRVHGDVKEGTTLALLVARDRTTKSVFSTVVPRKSTGDWISRRQEC